MLLVCYYVTNDIISIDSNQFAEGGGHTFNPSTREAETGEFLSSRLVRATK